jgi:Brp/Blh family beta-carotene 15,15'-monooxygenase
MNLFTFIYLIGVYIILNLFQGFKHIDLNDQLIYSSFFILLIGIPHGAIDHILLFKKRKISQFKFYVIYLGLIFLFLILWHLSVVYSLVLFLFISAFHFGESQFPYLKIRQLFKNIFYFLWGISLLSTLIFYNIDELKSITLFFDDTLSLEQIYDLSRMTILFYSTNILTIISLVIFMFLERMNIERFFSEIFLLFLIHITFYLFPFIIGFTLYFVALHSLKVMNDEFIFLKNENQQFKLLDFIKLLVPYSILSIFFTTILLLLSYNNIIDYSVPLLSLMIISVITLPHAIVMNIFYN